MYDSCLWYVFDNMEFFVFKLVYLTPENDLWCMFDHFYPLQKLIL